MLLPQSALIIKNSGDFTPVCTTELGMMVAYASKFTEQGAKLLGFSCDDDESHKGWIKVLDTKQKAKV